MKQPSNITLTSITSVKKSIAMSMKQFTRTVDNQRWKLDVNWNVLTHSEYRELSAFLIDKASTAFTVQIPELKDGGGSWDNVAIDETALDLVNATRILKVTSTNALAVDVVVGDFFTIGGYTKVYQVTELITTDFDGNPANSIKFFPAIANTLTVGDVLDGTDVSFTVKVIENEMAVPITNKQTYSMSYTALEV